MLECLGRGEVYGIMVVVVDVRARMLKVRAVVSFGGVFAGWQNALK